MCSVEYSIEFSALRQLTLFPLKVYIYTRKLAGGFQIISYVPYQSQGAYVYTYRTTIRVDITHM